MLVDLQLISGRTLDIVTQAVAEGAYGGSIAADYGRYTVGAAMTRDGGKAHRRRRRAGTAQYRLLVGALASLSRGDHAPGTDARLLPAARPRDRGWAPSFTDCARCGAPGPHTAFSVPLGGMVCRECRPPGSPRRRRRRSLLLGALLTRGLDDGGRVRRPCTAARQPAWWPATCSGIWNESAIPQTCGANVSSSMGAEEAGRHRPPGGPDPHPSRRRSAGDPAGFVPRHVAIVMDGNGRWANQRGLPRIEGHKAGEPALLDVDGRRDRAGHRVRQRRTRSPPRTGAVARGGALPHGLQQGCATPAAATSSMSGVSGSAGPAGGRSCGAR